MALPMHQRYEIIFVSQHPLGLKLGHKSMMKVVKHSTSTVQRWLSRWKQSKNLNDSDRTGRVLCNDSKTGSINCLACRTTDICYKPRHHEPIEKKTNQDQRENGATTLERSESKVQLAFVKGITHRKASNESFKTGARSQRYGLEQSDLL